ncbi:hypothetical protein B591_20533 [Streptomyces sp. GBA 94-10 4N24]|uniref:hypothetical protein n=1 Tax=Streptomyces sp. GBA 94-10 4N24 TaxID=1218177 RepID=UPI0003C30AB2|nr:hypothetical protein [Streptomyces sp. GBA 94-10 4N24]ESP97962.1 hypothetical protein B591_20533 [Streptomyces sp. GBA 94-10 4N24]UZN61141.1 hypothetical protein B591N_20533 [Streptomyces sp. GBA 94-10 4N24]
MRPGPSPQSPGPASPHTGTRAAAEAAYADWVLSSGGAPGPDAAQAAFRALGDGLQAVGSPEAGNDGPPAPELRAMAGVVRHASFETAGDAAQMRGRLAPAGRLAGGPGAGRGR